MGLQPLGTFAHVWKGQRFSSWTTALLHKFPDNSNFDNQVQQTDLEYLFLSNKALASFAENYTCLPF